MSAAENETVRNGSQPCQSCGCEQIVLNIETGEAWCWWCGGSAVFDRPIVHRLKIWPEWFAAVVDGRKKAELRRDDRRYRTGDRLLLEEYDPFFERYTGRSVLMEVTHCTRLVGLYPELDDFVLLSMKAVTD